MAAVCSWPAVAILLALLVAPSFAFSCRACDQSCEDSCNSQSGSCSYNCFSSGGIVSASCTCVEGSAGGDAAEGQPDDQASELIFLVIVIGLFVCCCVCIVVSCAVCLALMLHPFPVGCLIAASVVIAAIVAQVSVTGLVSDFFSLLFNDWEDLLPSVVQIALAPAVGAVTLVGLSPLNYFALVLDAIIVYLELWNFTDLFVTDSLFPGISMLSAAIGVWIVCLTMWQFLMVARLIKAKHGEAKRSEGQLISSSIYSTSAPTVLYHSPPPNVSGSHAPFSTQHAPHSSSLQGQAQAPYSPYQTATSCYEAPQPAYMEQHLSHTASAPLINCEGPSKGENLYEL